MSIKNLMVSSNVCLFDLRLSLNVCDEYCDYQSNFTRAPFLTSQRSSFIEYERVDLPSIIDTIGSDAHDVPGAL